MKKIILCLFAVFMVFLLNGCTNEEIQKSTLEKIKQEDKIIIGTKTDSKPFCYKENGALKGYDIDLAKLIAEKLLGDKNKVQFVEIKTMDRIFALNSKKVDIIVASMSITPTRLEVIDFSSPYYIAGQALIVKANSNIKSLKELDGKSIGFVLGSTGEATIRYFLPKANIRSAKTYPEVFNYLENGSIEAVLADDSILYSRYKNNKKYTILPKRYSKEFYGIAIRKEDADLKEKINIIIEGLQKDGSLTKLKNKWI